MLKLHIHARTRVPDRRVTPDCRCRDPFSEPRDDRAEVLLDLRGAPMGEQIGKTLAAAELLVSGERMRQQCDELCWPLLAMLDSRGYRYRILELNEDGVQLLVWKLSPEAGPDGSPIRRAA